VFGTRARVERFDHALQVHRAGIRLEGVGAKSGAKLTQRPAKVIHDDRVEYLSPCGSGDRVLDRPAGVIEGDQKVLA
jgi:hypothetical protein